MSDEATGWEIREWRLERGLSTRELAERLGVTEEELELIEAGRYVLTPAQVTAVRNWLGRPFDAAMADAEARRPWRHADIVKDGTRSDGWQTCSRCGRGSTTQAGLSLLPCGPEHTVTFDEDHAAQTVVARCSCGDWESRGRIDGDHAAAELRAAVEGHLGG